MKSTASILVKSECTKPQDIICTRTYWCALTTRLRKKVPKYPGIPGWVRVWVGNGYFFSGKNVPGWVVGTYFFYPKNGYGYGYRYGYLRPVPEYPNCTISANIFCFNSCMKKSLSPVLFVPDIAGLILLFPPKYLQFSAFFFCIFNKIHAPISASILAFVVN